MLAEVARLRRIEAKADNGIRQGIARQIQELQVQLRDASDAAMARKPIPVTSQIPQSQLRDASSTALRPKSAA